MSLVVRDARVFSTGSSFLVAAALMFGLCWVFAGLGKPKWPWRLAAGIAFGSVAIASGLRPIPMGQAVGALALLLAFSGVLLMILVACVFAVRNLRPSAPLAVLRLRRVPVLTFIVVWMLVTSTVQGTDHYHDVRLMAASTTKPRPVTPSAAVSQWLAAHGGAAAANPATGRAPVSMVFVATYGGGIRSAYWTNLVLDCLFAPGAEPVAAAPSCSGTPLDESSVFAESGVSGGAVGIAMHRVLGAKAFQPVLDQDFVSPDIAAMVFRDAPAFWIPSPFKPVGHDRAAVMEKSWERATGGAMAEGLFASAWQTPTQLRFPLTVFDSATVDDGCRLNSSVLAAATKDETASSTGCYTMAPFAPAVGQQVGSAGFTETGSPGAPTQSEPVLAGTKDLYDYLCAPGDPAHSRDIALSSASLLAARFPYISPTGGLTGCNNDPTAKQSRTFTMDGGVIDNSGASALGELWSGIAGQIADYDNDRDEAVLRRAEAAHHQQRLRRSGPGRDPAPAAGVAGTGPRRRGGGRRRDGPRRAADGSRVPARVRFGRLPGRRRDPAADRGDASGADRAERPAGPVRAAGVVAVDVRDRRSRAPVGHDPEPVRVGRRANLAGPDDARSVPGRRSVPAGPDKRSRRLTQPSPRRQVPRSRAHLVARPASAAQSGLRCRLVGPSARHFS